MRPRTAVRAAFAAALALAVLLAATPAAEAASGGAIVPVFGVSRLARCAHTALAGTPAQRNVLGRVLKVTPGAAFALRATRSQAVDDFDVDFHRSLRPCEQDANVTRLPHEHVDGNEFGIVPGDARAATITLQRGAPAATFTYTEGSVKRDPRPAAGIVVALIDTGIRATHEVFNYCRCGKTGFIGTRRDPDPTDQIAAWWDFTPEKPSGGHFAGPSLPQRGEIWYDRVKDPFDRFGHGTGTASLAVGRNVDYRKDPSFAPGYKLAVAKVGEGDGAVTGDLVAALRWAVDSARADVVSMSIGTLVPLPAALSTLYPELARARKKGVLVVVSNGNGWGNLSLVPGEPGWATGYGNSTNVLAVGASAHAAPLEIQGGTYDTMEAEVTAKYFDVGVATISGNGSYGTTGGTSFSAPIVAGMAARLKAVAEPAARKQHKSVSPRYLELLLKYSARDTNAPPNDEGYGRLDYRQLTSVALRHGARFSLPRRPDPDPNAMYVEQFRGALTDVWTNDLYL